MSENPRSMKEVSHTPPTGDSVTNVWDRGLESKAAESDEPAPADD
ncbi:hypothetical protein [Halogeometricum rufum]|nr:hypothetical protein [Halogeometricum rufum]